jgi:hypothetical protein
MGIILSNRSGCAILATILFAPAIVTGYILHSAMWLILVPLGIIALALIVAVIPSKRKVTCGQFADELEKHLLGIEGPWDWDDTTTVAIADERLERLRSSLFKFDSIERQEDKDELKSIIESLRRGEIPEVGQHKNLTFRDRRFLGLRLKD